MFHLTSERFKARVVLHATPESPDNWQGADERHYEAVEAEIARRAEGGDPGEAPWASARYFDVETGHDSAVQRAMVVLRHLSGDALTQLLVMGELLRTRLAEPGTTAPARHRERPVTEACRHVVAKAARPARILPGGSGTRQESSSDEAGATQPREGAALTR
nr:hypothetical protein OG461_30375 [Streptomyces sp. NBC_00995]